jgi:NADH-quinone oxidoreductase subunit E
MARLTAENVQRARQLISLYPQSRSALIPMLHVAQEQDGWLTPDGMAHVAELLDIDPAEVYGTASFYDMFFTHPVGTYLVSVCTNLACLLNGAGELLEHAQARLGVAPGNTTADGRFTLEEVECIAFCGAAPCLAVNWRFFGNIGDDDFDRLVDDLAAGRLADDVPTHGTLCRVRRTVGLPAANAVPAGGGSDPADGAMTPPQGAAAGVTDARGEDQATGSGSTAQAAGQAKAVEGSGS